MRLSPPAQRVLGALIEKAMATPQQYPLTLNALRAACNQRTGRDPVVDWDEDTVRGGVDELKAQQLVRIEYARGSRTPRYAHRADEQLDLDEAQHAVVALLLLRGPQTLGELRARAERLYDFPSLEAVEETLNSLANHRLLPLATMQAPQPGQKEARFVHLLGQTDDGAASQPSQQESPPASDPPVPAPPATGDPVAGLWDEVAALRAEVSELREQVSDLRDALPRTRSGPP